MSVQKRRTPAQWQQLVEQWQDSGLSATRFCKIHEIGYASFCNWRKRLTEAAFQAGPATTAEPAFIDLSTLQSPDSTSDTGWNIVLSLGNGVELRLSQH